MSTAAEQDLSGQILALSDAMQALVRALPKEQKVAFQVELRRFRPPAGAGPGYLNLIGALVKSSMVGTIR